MGHVVHNPINGFKSTVQQSVWVGEAVEVQRLEQELAVTPHLWQPAADPRFGTPALAPPLRAAQPAPAQRQSHGSGELPPPAAAHTHATTASSPTHSAF